MKLNKRQAFFAIAAIWLVLCLLYQSIWIFSRTAPAEIVATRTTAYKRTGINWIQGSYQVGDKTYYDSYLQDGYDPRDHTLEIRYLLFAPGISRANTFASNWGPLIMLFIILVLITAIVFIRKDIVTDLAVFTVQAKWPFVSVANNQIEDFDKHTLEDKNPTTAEQDLKASLEAEVRLLQTDDISTSVYKYNPNAVGIFVVYVFFFFWFFYSLLTGSWGYPGILTFGSILVFVPLYIQNTNNPVFKTRIPDQGSLIFSPDGIQFKEDFYSVDDIGAVVVYLEAFKGFSYRDRVTTGNVNTVSSGDNNKISYSCKGEVIDLIFILDQAADYWSLKNLLTNWAGRGIRILLQKVFEDDFMVQEMVHFQTPVSDVYEGV